MLQLNQQLFYRGSLAYIQEIHAKHIVVKKWKNGNLFKIKVKDISLHPKGAAWKATKGIKLI